MNIPEELERMEREEEERRNVAAERRLERQGHGTSGWDGWIVDCYVRSTPHHL